MNPLNDDLTSHWTAQPEAERARKRRGSRDVTPRRSGPAKDEKGARTVKQKDDEHYRLRDLYGDTGDFS